MFKCNECNEEFKYNSLLKRHQSRKRNCMTDDDYNKKIADLTTEIETKINQSFENKTKCLFCEKEYLNKGNLSKHIHNVCLIKKNLEQTKTIIIQQQKEKTMENNIKNMENKLAKIIKNQSKNINITNNINTINNNNINNNVMININSFGKEDLSHISLDDYKKYLSGFFHGFIKFIEKVHFDDNMPENKNICITNLKSKYIHIFENNQWTTKEKRDVLDKFIQKKYNTLVDKCEELEESNELSEKILDDFLQFTKNYRDTYELSKTTPSVKKDFKKIFFFEKLKKILKII